MPARNELGRELINDHQIKSLACMPIAISGKVRKGLLVGDMRHALEWAELFRVCEGFRMPAIVTCPRALGRRPKASREGTRERCAATVPRALWGFGRGGSGGGDGIEVWALLIAAVGERI